MKQLLSITFLICSLSISCNTQPFRKETNEFKKFLNDNFKVSLKERAVYLIIPSCQCKNCIHLNGDELLTQKKQENFVLITSLDTINFKNFRNTLFDEENKTMKLSFLHYANQLVYVDNSKIVNIQKVKNFNHQIDSAQKNYLK